ncbi:CGCGG family rSAM-modified RiPP protein [Alicyclobacillus curvatus]|nr:CGCGG family rSAM-modified RiPP protein [Alicyclobacillus curvatus]
MMGNWSANLETEEYAADKGLIVEDAVEAILETTPGYFVNLAVSEAHGNPDSYLIPDLEERFGQAIRIQFIDQCGCGGYVYRVFRVHAENAG